MKKALTLTIIAVATIAAPGFCDTFDCSHGCSITCPDGGGCVYNHDTGACSTFCNKEGVMQLQSEGKAGPVGQNAKLTIRFQDVTQQELKKALEQLGIR